MLHKWIPALLAVFGLTVAYPSAATVISGADGPLTPTTDYTLPYRADGIFDFSSINIGANTILRFNAGMTNAKLLSQGDILVGGLIYATGINLILETPGQIILTGGIVADSINLIGGSGLGNGGAGFSACISVLKYNCGALGLLIMPPTASILPGAGSITKPILYANPVDPLPGAGSITLTPFVNPVDPLSGTGGITLYVPEPGTRLLSVPEPGTLWLMTLLLPMLVLLGRKQK